MYSRITESSELEGPEEGPKESLNPTLKLMAHTGITPTTLMLSVPSSFHQLGKQTPSYHSKNILNSWALQLLSEGVLHWRVQRCTCTWAHLPQECSWLVLEEEQGTSCKCGLAAIADHALGCALHDPTRALPVKLQRLWWVLKRCVALPGVPLLLGYSALPRKLLIPSCP